MLYMYIHVVKPPDHAASFYNINLADKPDEGQLTNRSEATWKSWASFGTKLGRSSNRSNKGKKKKKVWLKFICLCYFLSATL